MEDDEEFSSPFPSMKQRKLNNEWDYVSSPILTVNSWNKDNINPNHPSLLLKSANVEIDDVLNNIHPKESKSNQSRIFDSTEWSSQEEFFASSSRPPWSDYSDYWAAPLKHIKHGKYKEILKTTDK